MRCDAMRCDAMLRYAMLRYAMLRYAMLQGLAAACEALEGCAVASFCFLPRMGAASSCAPAFDSHAPTMVV
jgi:hypothetical protein